MLVSKTFDTVNAAVIVHIKDGWLGNTSVHTIYVAGPNGVDDVAAEITKIEAEADDLAKGVYDRLIAAGWVPGGNPTS